MGGASSEIDRKFSKCKHVSASIPVHERVSHDIYQCVYDDDVQTYTDDIRCIRMYSAASLSPYNTADNISNNASRHERTLQPMS